MSVLCVSPAFLPFLLWEGCFLYLFWVRECSLCTSNISTPPSVGRMFSVPPLGAWVFSVLQQHFYPPPSPPPLWEECFLYLWVCENPLCSTTISILPSVGIMFSVLLGVWKSSVFNHHFYPSLCGNSVFYTSGRVSDLCVQQHFYPSLCGNNVFWLWVRISVLQQLFYSFLCGNNFSLSLGEINAFLFFAPGAC